MQKYIKHARRTASHTRSRRANASQTPLGQIKAADTVARLRASFLSLTQARNDAKPLLAAVRIEAEVDASAVEGEEEATKSPAPATPSTGRLAAEVPHSRSMSGKPKTGRLPACEPGGSCSKASRTPVEVQPLTVALCFKHLKPRTARRRRSERTVRRGAAAAVEPLQGLVGPRPRTSA